MRERAKGIPVAVAQVLSTHYIEGLAVFLTVGLRQFQTDDQTPEGRPLEATVRWAPAYHGAGYGDWHIPDVGADVVCIFPGLGTDGVIGRDLDNGLAIAHVSSKPEPPVHSGLAGDLSPTRRVYKGKLGVAHDRHYQGDVDELTDGDETTQVCGDRNDWVERDETTQVDGSETRVVSTDSDRTIEGNETTEVGGTSSRTVIGNETQSNVGTVQRLFAKAAEWIGTLTMRIKASTTLTLEGTVEAKLLSDAKVTIDGTTLCEILGLTVNAGNGGSAFEALVLLTFLTAKYDQHVHWTGSQYTNPPKSEYQSGAGDSTLFLKGN